MILISHRANTIKDLKKTNKIHGIEIDLRDEKKRIYIQHDPFKKGVLLQKYLKSFKHKFIICNIKSERIEFKVIKILKKYSIKNYFFLDSSFPMKVICVKNKIFNQSIRLSKYERFPKTSFFSKVKWVWLDTFDGLPKHTLIKSLKRKKKKICLVSPELHGLKIKKNQIRNFLKKNYKFIDMVCTKRKFFRNWTI
jgi:hypothetical protein